MFNKLLQLILFVVFIFTCELVFAEEQKIYNPYPIIFVHGYNNVRTTEEKLWEEVKENFEKYFVTYSASGDRQSKYPDPNWQNYLNYFDYRAVSNGDLNARVPELKNVIDEVLKNTAQEKVIIVAHSAGGLITKRLLADYPAYQQKIEKVVFIGTPHQKFGVRYDWSSEFGEKSRGVIYHVS